MSIRKGNAMLITAVCERVLSFFFYRISLPTVNGKIIGLARLRRDEKR